MNKTAISRRNWLKVASSATVGIALSGATALWNGCGCAKENASDAQTSGENRPKPYFIRIKHIPCVDCAYCMPCKFGLDIPGIFRFVNERTAISETADDNLSRHPVPDDEKSFRTAYETAVPELRQADKCTGCKSCVPKCPEMIDIPGEMLKIAKITFR